MTVAENNFKIGDKVRVITSVYDCTYKDGPPPPKKGDILDVVAICASANQGVWIDNKTVEVETLNEEWQVGDFELYVEQTSTEKFNAGDKVISIKDTPEVPEGTIGYILLQSLPPYDYSVDINGAHEYFNEDELELLSAKQTSIARPILTERKVGKVQMDLFDQGFPNAVFEVAKVMTWAAQNKGYKPHDWVNLPDAESSFPAAASRHRVKGLIQKVSGVSVNERVDEESAILHKAHEAFNVLAELELMVRGKIK